MQLNPRKVSGVDNFTSTIKGIIREDGVFGFYRGLSISLFLCTHSVMFMGLYEKINSLLSFDRSGGGSQAWKPLASAVLSKIVASSLMYPIQVIRTRRQQR